MNKRINIVMPEKTLAVLDRVAKKGNRSRFICRAVLHLIESQGKETLRERLKQEALANAERDLEMAAEWFPLEEEVHSLDDAVKPRSARHRTKLR